MWDKALKTILKKGKLITPFPYLVPISGDSVKVMLPRKDDEVAAKCYRSLLKSMIDQNVAMILRYVYQVRRGNIYPGV